MTVEIQRLLTPCLAVDTCLETAENGALLFHLSEADSFVLESEEARRWCNGMFSNNIRKLGEGEGNRSAICDDRGRVQGLLDTYCLSETRFLCVLEGVDKGWFQERFKMLMILDDIELVQSEQGILSIQGSGAENVLADAGFILPERQHAIRGEIQVMRKDRTGHGGFDLLGSRKALASAAGKLLESGAARGSKESLECLRILSGRASWPVDGTKKSMVHELGIDKECCAFDKGCYVGQEIINRIDVKGLVNKRIKLIALDGPAELPAELFSAGSSAGRLTSMARYKDGYYGLATLRKAAWEPGTELFLEGGGGRVGKVV